MKRFWIPGVVLVLVGLVYLFSELHLVDYGDVFRTSLSTVGNIVDPPSKRHYERLATGERVRINSFPKGGQKIAGLRFWVKIGDQNVFPSGAAKYEFLQGQVANETGKRLIDLRINLDILHKGTYFTSRRVYIGDLKPNELVDFVCEYWVPHGMAAKISRVHWYSEDGQSRTQEVNTGI